MGSSLQFLPQSRPGSPCLAATTFFFSVCSGIWSLVFLGIGAGFIMIGAAFAPGGPIRNGLLEASGCDQTWSSEIDGDDTASAMAAGAVDCVQESVCGSVLSLADKVTAAATSIGVPYFLAGLVMFAGCYVCCCCKKSVPQKTGNDVAPMQGKQDEVAAVPAATPASGGLYPAPA